MGQWEPTQLATLGGLAIGILFGGVAQATAFCSSGAILDFVRSGDSDRLRAWLLAMAVAILSAQILLAFEVVDLRKAVYLTAPLNLAGPVLGGLMFGIGMMLAQGCAARNLVRLGGGNLRALVVVLVFSISAYAAKKQSDAAKAAQRPYRTGTPDARQSQRCRRAGTPCRSFGDGG